MTRRNLAIIAVGLVAISMGIGWWFHLRGKETQRSARIEYSADASALFKSGHITEAVVTYNRGIASAPGDPACYIGLAVLYEAVNRPDLAIDTLEQLGAANPKAPHLGCRLAEAHLGAEDLKQAREIGEKAVVDEPDCARAHSVYGLTMLRFRFWDTAAAELRKAIRQAPEDLEIGQLLVDVYIEQAAYDKAVELGESLLPKIKQPAHLHYKLGWAYGRRPPRGDSVARAIVHLQQANALAPEWFEPYAELGRLYRSQGRLNEARTSFEHAWKLNSSVLGVAYNLSMLWHGTDERRSAALDKVFHKLTKEKELFTAMRHNYNAAPDAARATLVLAAAEGETDLIGAALYRIRKLLNSDPANLEALKLYVQLDQRARARYADYLRPGPGVSVRGL